MAKKKKWNALPVWAGLALAGGVAAHSLVPDSTRGLFLKAQELENLGQYQLALRHYSILTRRHPQSAWAAQALNRQAAIVSSLGRDMDDSAPERHERLREAMGLFREVAHRYPTSAFAGDALVSAADIAFTELRDWANARALYAELLEKFPGSREYASQAIVMLGRVALSSGDREEAKRRFLSVPKLYPQNTERCAEAQYHLGLAYETLWSDKESKDHKQWAHKAYEATFKLYPRSPYAARAKDRLGLLVYDEAAQTPSSQRVLIEVPPIADDRLEGDTGASSTWGASPAGAAKSMDSALRLLLASRGLEVDEVTLRGWSLRPFVAGFDPSQPGRVVGGSGSDWESVLRSAGLRYAPSSGGKASEALADLKKEIDLARPPLIFNGRWSLAVGYDSSRGLVFLQSKGARVESMSAKELASAWDVDAPIGGRFAIVGVWAPGEKRQPPPAKPGPGPASRFEPKAGPKRSIESPTATPSPLATATPLPRLDTPTYTYALAPLSVQSSNARAVREGAAQLARPQAGRVLLGAEALGALARAFEDASRPAPQVLGGADSPDAPATPSSDELPARAAQGGVGSPESPLPSGEPTLAPDAARTPRASATPTPTARPASAAPTAAPLSLVARAARRAVELRAWFGSPLAAWVRARRDAAAFCARAGEQNKKPQWQQAASDLSASVEALEQAKLLAPLALAPGGSELDEPSRAASSEVAKLLRRARDAERRASQKLRQ